MISGDINNQIKLWDVKTRKVICTRDNAHKTEVWRCKFSPDGKWIASVSTDGSLKIWDAWTLKEIDSLSGHEKPVWTLDISSNGRLIATGSFDNTLKIWDVEQKVELGILRGHEDQIWGCAFFPNGTQLVSASWDSTLKIWDLSSIIYNQHATVKDDAKHTVNLPSEIRQRSLDVEISSSNDSMVPYTAVKPIDLTGPILCAAISPRF